MNEQEKRDLKIDKGVSIKEWIEYNVKMHGGENFFNNVKDNWDEISDYMKNTLLDEISGYIKPKVIKTTKDLAKLLDGNEYGDELRNEYGVDVYELCKKNGWVIAYGASDDLLELEGAIMDEFDAWDGCIIQFYKKGSFYPDYEDENTYHKTQDDGFYIINKDELKQSKDNEYQDTVIIESLWCPEDSNASWQINVAGAPFVKFNVMEDDELYCEAAIIDISNLLTK